MFRRILLILTILVLFTGSVVAETEDITKKCKFTATVDKQHTGWVTTDRYSNSWQGKGGVLTVKLPKNTPAQGLQLSFLIQACPVKVTALDAAGEPMGETVYDQRFLHAWVPLKAESAYQVEAVDPAADIRINRIRVFTGDERPREAQTWHEPEGPLDMLLIVTHPDDELLWFGGLLPTYAGERHMNVMVAYAAVQGALKKRRYNELLDGLWTCGVTAYPELGPFNDFQVKTVETVVKRWGEGAAQAWCTGLIRKYRPKVVVTQDLRGESGHKQHRALAQAVADAVTEWSGDASRDPESAALYGTYTPQKFYIHRYRENEIFMDWNQPLEAFGGQSGTQVAREAFRKHVSQQKTHYHIYVTGPLDSRYLGLYYSRVGEDVEKNDLFEHVE